MIGSRGIIIYTTDIAVPVAGMQRYYCRLTLVIAVGHSTPSNTLYYSLVVVLCMGMSL